MSIMKVVITIEELSPENLKTLSQFIVNQFGDHTMKAFIPFDPTEPDSFYIHNSPNELQ